MALKTIKSFFPDKSEQANVGFPWFLVLRWGAVSCQIILITVVGFTIDIDLPLLFLGLIICTEALSNLFLQFRFRKEQDISEEVIFIIFILDSLLLTGLLHLTGGAMNPFTFLYLVHIVIAAIILPSKYSWSITLLIIACYGLLFLPSPITVDLSGKPVPESNEICHLDDQATGAMILHLRGMWVAFTVTCFFIVFFVSQIQKDLSVQNQTLLFLKETRLRNEQLASLTGLAAGAAHELSTPLGTVAVAAGEMIHQLQNHNGDPDLIEDAILIKEQVSDCKEILYQMAAGAGELKGEELQAFTVDQAIEQILSELTPDKQQLVDIKNNCKGQNLHMGFRTLCRTLKGLLNNSIEASKMGKHVQMKWFTKDGMIVIEVTDHGIGMSQEVLQQATEPFFTTKETGMGLGLFLTKTMAEQFGGKIELASTPENKTTVSVFLALDRVG